MNSDTYSTDEPILTRGPYISIRVRVLVSFLLFSLLALSIIGWSWVMLTRVEHKTEFLEVTEGYMDAVLQARRYEKNWLLYNTDLPEALAALKQADTIARNNSAKIRKIISAADYAAMLSRLEKYHAQLVRLGQAPDDAARQQLEPGLRRDGSQVVEFAAEFVHKEQAAVQRMFVLAKRIPLYFISVLVVLMTGVILFMMRQLMATFNRFLAYTVRIGDGDFTPIEQQRTYRDEFTELANAFNQMTHELHDKQAALVESHKLRAIGTLVAGVAHELNNPLNNTLLTSSMLIEEFADLSEAEKLEMLGDVVSETERSKVIVKNLLDFSREGETQLAALEVESVVRDSTRLVGNQVRFARVKLEVSSGRELPKIYADRQKLQQVLVNLILNAVDALGSGGTINVDAEIGKRPDTVQISVHDDGPGIPLEIQSRIFDPFFTTKEHGKGTGLGLSVSAGIVARLGGEIQLESTPGEGTTFTITLPAGEPPIQEVR